MATDVNTYGGLTMQFQPGSTMFRSITQIFAHTRTPHPAADSHARTFRSRTFGEALIKVALPCIIALFAIAQVAPAQSTMSATVVGTVTDPAGAVVPKAAITLTNMATGVATKGTTNADGAYYIPYLAPGTYTLTIAAAGFQTYAQTGILLELGQVPRFDVKLTVGATSSVVQVSATSTPLLDTESVDIGGIAQADFIENQPMMQSKPYYVMNYTMGSEYGGNNTFILAGLPGNFINYSIDGMTAKQSVRSAIGTVNNSGMPAVDAIQEAHVWTTGIPAELGHDAGGAEIVALKSGTNDVHWTAEERYINKDWIHHEIFQDGLLTTPFEYHNFDSTLSFPIFIPHIYDGRNKSFLFLGERWDYDHETNESVVNVPTPGMLGQDPSNPGNYEFNWAGAQPIYDPATFTCTGGTGPSCAGGTWSATQFPGNIIPGNRIDPVAKAFLALNPYAAQTTTPTYTATGPNNNLEANTFYLADKEGYSARFDQTLGTNDKMFFHWIYNMYHTHPGRQSVVFNLATDYLLDPTSASFARPEPYNTVNYVINETHVFGPSLINEFHVGYQSRADKLTVFADNQNWAGKLGIPGVPASTMPVFTSSGNSSAAWSSGPGTGWRIIQDEFTFADDMTKTIGHHVFKGGWELLRVREDDTGTESDSATSEPLPSGTYTFSGITTAYPYNKPSTGNSFASFILGAPDYAGFSEQLEPYLPRWWSNELYFEDSWQLKPNLTVNLGIRYALELSGNTKNGFKSEFNPTATDPLTGDMGAITNPTGPIYSGASTWAPRIGVAYNFRPQWVFRGAFDMFTADNMTEMGMDNYEATYYVAPPTGSPLPGMYLSTGPGAINYPIQSNHTANFVSRTGSYSGRTATYFDPNLHNGHTMSWTAGVQYQFKPNTMIEIDYIGSAGYGLINPNPVNINDLPQSIYTSTNTTMLNTVYANQQSYLPFPQFGSINYYSNWDGSIYHSGIIDFQKRLSRGITWDFHYTYQKLLDEGPGDLTLSSTGVSAYTVGTGPELNVVGGNNPNIVSGATPLSISYNKAATKVIDPGSYKSSFTGTVTWDIPVGRNRRFMNHGGIANVFLGDWRLLTIQNLRSGNAMEFLQAGNPNKELPGEVFMNRVPGQNLKTPNFKLIHNQMWPETNQTPYLNINAFAYPAAFTQGNVGTDPGNFGGVWWPQYSVTKTVAYHEKYQLEVRLDTDMLFPEFHQMSAFNTAANITSPSLFGKTASQGYDFSVYGSRNGTYIGVLRLAF